MFNENEDKGADEVTDAPQPETSNYRLRHPVAAYKDEDGDYVIPGEGDDGEGVIDPELFESKFELIT